MIELPDVFYLNKITTRCAYCDEKSIDHKIPRSRSKRKYKLSGGKILDQYFFHILTSTGDACRKEVTLIIDEDHWEERSKAEYLNGTSYCDLRKYELLSEQTIIEKSKDMENGFEYAAKLCNAKCQELLEVNAKLRKNPYISQEIKDTIGMSMSEIVPEKVLKDLGI